MGKSITEVEYQAACGQLDTCRQGTCRNGHGGPDAPPCKTCVRAFRVKKEYERVRRA